MKRFAVLVGHRTGAKGAHSPHLLTNEYEFNSYVADKLIDVADIYNRDNIPFVSEGYRIKKVVDEINWIKYDLVVSLHFNSAESNQAHGCTALHYITNKKTKQLGRIFTEMIEERIGIKKRDLIPISSKKQRGGTFIIHSKSDALLLEPFFGSNKGDCDLISECINEYVDIIKDLFKMVSDES